jgi:thiamine-monophosphate kinase
MLVGELGEFPLIARLQQVVQTERMAHIVCGMGDDCAVVRASAASDLLLTTDTQEEDVHFRRAWATPQDIGWRCLAVNVSDIAAMGGMPLGAVVALSIPATLEVAFVEQLYEGLQAVATAYHCPILGGNISKNTAGLSVTITVLGEVPHGQSVYRHGAQVGDDIWVTGVLGGARAGLEVLRHPTEMAALSTSYVLERYRRPRPRLREAQYLRQQGVLHSLLDISDGLSSDLGHICAASGVGAQLQSMTLPLHTEVHHVAQAVHADPLSFVLHGGEDFELCFTTAPGALATIQESFAVMFQCPLTRIGTICPGQGDMTLRLADGTEHLLHARGYDHFRASFTPGV